MGLVKPFLDVDLPWGVNVGLVEQWGAQIDNSPFGLLWICFLLEVFAEVHGEVNFFTEVLNLGYIVHVIL